MDNQSPKRVFYTPELGVAICNHLMEGKSLRQIEKLPGMPAARSVFRWLEQDESFRLRYRIAHEIREHMLVDEIKELADGERIPWPTEERVQKAWIKRVKLMINARLWLHEKQTLKKYTLW